MSFLPKLTIDAKLSKSKSKQVFFGRDQQTNSTSYAKTKELDRPSSLKKEKMHKA